MNYYSFTSLPEVDTKVGFLSESTTIKEHVVSCSTGQTKQLEELVLEPPAQLRLSGLDQCASLLSVFATSRN